MRGFETTRPSGPQRPRPERGGAAVFRATVPTGPKKRRVPVRSFGNLDRAPLEAPIDAAERAARATLALERASQQLLARLRPGTPHAAAATRALVRGLETLVRRVETGTDAVAPSEDAPERATRWSLDVDAALVVPRVALLQVLGEALVVADQPRSRRRRRRAAAPTPSPECLAEGLDGDLVVLATLIDATRSAAALWWTESDAWRRHLRTEPRFARAAKQSGPSTRRRRPPEVAGVELEGANATLLGADVVVRGRVRVELRLAAKSAPEAGRGRADTAAARASA